MIQIWLFSLESLWPTRNIYIFAWSNSGFLWQFSGRESVLQCRICGFDPRVRKMPWRKKRQSTPVFLPSESQGRGAWWAAICGVAQSQTQLKRLSSSSWWCEELTHWKRPWCWKRLKAGGKGDNRGWDGWMASPTQWTWVLVDSRSWWWTGLLVCCCPWGCRVGHDWATELNWTSAQYYNELNAALKVKSILKNRWIFWRIPPDSLENSTLNLYNFFWNTEEKTLCFRKQELS